MFVPPLKEAFSQHGDVLEVSDTSFPLFFFRNPEHIQQIIVNDPVTAVTKPGFILPRVKTVMGNGTFISSSRKEWGKRNWPVRTAFSKTMSAEYATSIHESVEAMFNRWDNLSQSPLAFDLFKEMKRLIVDYTFRHFFSCNLGHDLHTVEESTHFMVERFLDTGPLWSPTAKNWRYRHEVSWLKNFIEELIKDHLLDSTKNDDLISKLLRFEETETAMEWNKTEIRDELLSFYFGMSNLGTSLSWVLYTLSLYPDVYEKVADELSRELEGRPPSLENIASCSYLQMVMKESMRLYPAVWGYARMTLEKMGVDGFSFPPGAVLFPFVYFAHRHPAYWDEPDVFKPERFSPERDTKIHRYAYFPFGGGQRMCMGRHLAPFVIQLVVASIVQRYSFRYAPTLPGEPLISFEFELLPKNGLPMVFERRKHEVQSFTLSSSNTSASSPLDF